MPTSVKQVEAPSAAQPPARRILLVDDDPLIRQALRLMLESDGHEVTTADGGQAAIAMFLSGAMQGTPFPVVMTDMTMPDVDGCAVADAVKAAAPETLLLLLTGCPERILEDRAAMSQIDRVLCKPPRRSELRAALLAAKNPELT